VFCSRRENAARSRINHGSGGAAVPNAEVVAKDSTNGLEFKATTTTAGIYRIPYMPAGNVSRDSNSRGIQDGSRRAVLVSVAAVVTANVAMQVGDVTQSVTVDASDTHLDTSTSQIGYSVTPEEFRTWPIDSSDCGQRQIQAFIYNSLPGAIGCPSGLDQRRS